MFMIVKLKRAIKSAIKGGKIYFVGTKFDSNFDCEEIYDDIRLLNGDEWVSFEDRERKFRALFASKRTNHGDFICRGIIGDWIKVAKILSGIFYQNNKFLAKKLNGAQWSVSFLKFVCRSLRLFPRDDNYCINNAADRIEYINKQLNYINNTIIPFFSSKRRGNDNRNEVSKEKLTCLWLQRRKKAISIIRNNGYWPNIENAEISVQRNEDYYAQSSKFAECNGFEGVVPPFFDREEALASVKYGQFFSYDEIESTVKGCPSGKSCGADGVTYEDMKEMIIEDGYAFVNILNVLLVNLRIPASWKKSIVQRIPKKNFSINDLSTLRDVSLLPTSYKVFSKAICKRITPLISNEIAFWQRAFLPDRDRQELIFSLKATMDDFRHLSTKFCAVFVDFADAFGSIEHSFLFETLREFDIPLIYCCLVEDLYRYSSFSVICGFELSKEFNIIRGTKTGDPLSALLFILVIDRVCKPMVREAVVRRGIEDERRINPLPLQAFADDVVVVNYDATIINDMFDIGQVAMEIAGLEVKPSKCAVMYARRSGNNWYKGKADKKPTVSIQGNAIEVYPRDKSYKYLGKALSLSGEDTVQVYEVIESYKDLLEKITSCKLPLSLKASALNNMALAKILHHFYNTRFTEEQLELMDKSLVKAVRNMYDLYETTTQLIIFLPREHGGIGVKRVSDVYRSTRVAFLIKMLNHPQLQFKNIARQSLDLDMKKRKVAATDNDMNFLGFEISEDGYLNNRTNFGCQSDWPDLLRYARKLDVSIEFRQGKAGVIINGEFFDEGAPLQKLLFKQTVNRDVQKANRLSIQGPFLCMIDVQLKSSHSIFYNWKVSDLLVKFAIKARLSLLPTNFTKHIWNRHNDPSCPFCHQHTESVAHLMNGCREFHNFYSRRHNRIADKIFEVISGSLSGFQFHANKLAESIMTDYGDELRRITHRKPDILVIDNQSRKCIILEVTVCYDLYFEQALNTKQERYQPLCSLLQLLGWDVDLKVLCFGSLGCIKKDVWTVMRSLSVDKLIVKNTLQWCSVSNLIMANYIWRHRVKKLFS